MTGKMSEIINVYCDESCHLENDRKKSMVLGAIWCPLDKTKKTADHIRAIKIKHFGNQYREIKWNKVSDAKLDFYIELLDYFFNEPDLHFRAVIADKTKLDHEKFLQTHDEWYYKIYFTLLKIILNPDLCYRIYIDIKDTQGGNKVKKLKEVLCNSHYDFSQKIIERLQITHSHEVEQLQLADLLIGALSYYHNVTERTEAKMSLINKIKESSHYSLDKNTLFKEDKFNLFFWEGY